MCDNKFINNTNNLQLINCYGISYFLKFTLYTLKHRDTSPSNMADIS